MLESNKMEPLGEIRKMSESLSFIRSKVDIVEAALQNVVETQERCDSWIKILDDLRRTWEEYDNILVEMKEIAGDQIWLSVDFLREMLVP